MDLDDLTLYDRIDPSGMRKHLMALPRQCAEAWQRVQAFPLPQDYATAEHIVCFGMGGSAIGCDLASSLVSRECRVPFLVFRGYEVPSFVDSRTLVITSSYSGETEEVLTCFEEAQKRGAKLLAITTGGELGLRAGAAGVPIFPIEYSAPPRAALGYGLIPLLGVLDRLGFVSSKARDLEEMVTTLEGLQGEIHEGVPFSRNGAKSLAQRLLGRLPVIYGAGILAEVARRCKTQINENGKAWAFHEVFPELNHNAVVGYQCPSSLAEVVYVVLLEAPSIHPRIQLRYQITREILEKAGVSYERVEGRGNSLLSQMMSVLFFGDYVSYYLALLYGVDPSPVEIVDYLKRRLGRSPDLG